MGNYCYVAVCSAVLGTSAPTEGGEGRGHIVAATCLQLVIIEFDLWSIQLISNMLCYVISSAVILFIIHIYFFSCTSIHYIAYIIVYTVFFMCLVRDSLFTDIPMILCHFSCAQ